MIEARFKPISKWPKKPTPQDDRKNRFRADWRSLLDGLEFELRKLGAKNIIIEAFIPADQIRNDGWPYTNARPTQPGIILKFSTDKGSGRVRVRPLC
jgi:hypothetical protein